jgi:mono/diheme cytochrome c family protein
MTRRAGLFLTVAAFVCSTAAAPVDGPAGTWEAPPEARNIKRPTPADEKSVERGRKLFKQNCVPCHGESGKGDGTMGKAMGIKPGNLTNAERMGKHTDGEIFWKVSKGKDPMPVFEKKLSEKDRWDLVAHVRTLAK